MIILDSTLKSLEVILPGAITTNQLPWTVAFVDVGAAVPLVEGDGVTNGGTGVTIVAAPSAGNQRMLKHLSVVNADTVSQKLTLRINNNATMRNVFIVTLAVGDQLIYTADGGFQVFDLNGNLKQTPLALPVTVPNGGTGVTTLTAHGVLVGEGTGAIVATAVGTSGQVLTSNGPGVDPTFQASAGGTAINGIVEFRLTLTTGVPVTTADVTGATTVFCSPYSGNRIVLYDGANWNMRTSAEFSIALGVLASGTPYDIFCYDNAGVPTLELLAWATNTARATALVLQDGVLSKTGALTRRYLGTFFTTSTSATEDSVTKRYLWNYYNRVRRLLQRYESASSWTYTTAVVRQANANPLNQVEIVTGWGEVDLDLSLNLSVSNSTGGTNVSAGIGEDSNTTYLVGALSTYSANAIGPVGLRLTRYPSVGRHVYSWNEWGAAVGTTTWWANIAGVGSTVVGGLTGSIPG